MIADFEAHYMGGCHCLNENGLQQASIFKGLVPSWQVV